MDSSAATAMLAAVAATSMWEGIAIYSATGDPCPFYKDKTIPAKVLLEDWRRMFPPAMWLQARLVVLGTAASSLAVWGLRDSNGAAAASFGVSAGALVGIFAYTMKAIMPINRRLLPEGRVEEKESEEGIRALLQQWAEAHGFRTILGAVALGGCLVGVHTCLTTK